MAALSAPAERPAALALRGVTKRFGDVVALDDVSLDVRAGTVHALLGENGAGKSTLMRVAFGLLAPDGGSISLAGVPCTPPFTPRDAMARGLGMVHQHFSLVAAMTVAENVALGAAGRYDAAKVASTVRAIGDRTGLVLDPAARVGDLPVSAQQRCEIVKALARDVRVLILDEPTAVLAPDEAQALLRWVRAFADSDPSHAVVLITHKLRDALAVADDITVLRRGVRVAHGPVAQFTEASLADAMLGPGERSSRVDAEVREAHTPRAPAADQAREGRDVLHAHQVVIRDTEGITRVRDASFTVHAGEIVGLAAVEGSGQHALLRAMAGLLPVAAGRLQSPTDVAFVPEDRHRDALLLDASLTENLALRDAGRRSGQLPWRTLAERTTALLSARDVRAAGATAIARTLSGGNQQKFVLARALDDAPSALIVENPTRGLDFRATAAVHDALRAARDAGLAVLVYSSDLDEVLAVADRVLALHDGVVHEVARERDTVGRAMLGVVSDASIANTERVTFATRTPSPGASA
ncbi:MAG: ATP-binding cassette domain-containing protein [Gemmatimonadaceae bacterium]|jgi:simple sugar transport system ATP-binding protein|nr:ATP-binding cassette domain-containing protein [Gemmatimonadaceae bacterium]